MAVNRQLGTLNTRGPFSIWAQFDTQRAGRITDYWRTIMQNDPLMRNVVMVIDLRFGGDLGGFRVRVATEPVWSVSSETGRDHSAVGGLVDQPTLDQVYEACEATSSARTLTITLSTEFVDPAALVQNGIPLFGYAEVSLEPVRRPGGVAADYDSRLVLLRGDIGGSGGPRFGALRTRQEGTRTAEVLELQIADPRDSVHAKFPPWIADDSRFDVLNESWQGEKIPVVLNSYSGIPALRASQAPTGVTHDWVVCHGHTWTVDVNTGVRVNGVVKAAADATYGWTQVSTYDNKNVPITVVRFTNVATVWEDTDIVHVDVETTGDEFNVISSLEYLLKTYSPFGVDGLNMELFSTTSARFGNGDIPQILINEVREGQSGLQWAEDTFLESLPMLSMIWQGGRYGPILTDFRSRPVASWVVGANPIFDRVSLLEELPKSAIENEFVLRYDYDPFKDVYRKVQVRGAENSDVCAYSQAIAGSRHAAPVTSFFIVDDSLATYVIDWMVAHKSLPSYYVEYECSPHVFMTRRRGDTVQLTDDDFGWTEQPATVERLTIMRAKCVVGLRVWVRYIDLGGAAFSYSN